MGCTDDPSEPRDERQRRVGRTMTANEDLEELKKRRAVFYLHPQDIRHMLQVPDDTTIWNIWWDEPRNTFAVLCVNESFGVVHDGCEAPMIGVKRTWKQREQRMVVELGEYGGPDATVVEE